jgi:hypothetical protein
MSYLIGRGRYAREAFPVNAQASGGGSILPLSRQRFIDGDTTQPGNGSASNPFPTIAAFMASRTNVSVPDAATNYVGWITPKIGGYVENVSFPPYATTELRADSFSFPSPPGGGANILGIVTWNNIAGANTPATALVTMHNVPVAGSFTVTDDAGAPPSRVLFGGDSPFTRLGGGFNASAATNFESVVFDKAEINGTLNAGTGSVFLIDSVCTSSILGSDLRALNSNFSGSALTLTSSAFFVGCIFNDGSSPVLTTPLANFDGPSWASFLEAGGTRGVGTVVLVVGGYSGASVEGATLPNGGSVDVSLDGSGASAGYTGEDSGNHYSTPDPFDTDLTVSLKTGGAKEGDTLCITKGTLGNTLTVENSVNTLIGTIPNLERGFILSRFTAGEWVFMEGGSLTA